MSDFAVDLSVPEEMPAGSSDAVSRPHSMRPETKRLCAQETAHDGLQCLFRVEAINDLETLERHSQAWAELTSNAIHPAPTSSPQWLLPALRHLGVPGAQASVIAVWCDEWRGEDLKKCSMIGLFTQTLDLPFKGLPVRVACHWQHLFSFIGAPLLHRDYAHEALGAYLDELEHRGARGTLLRLLPSQGPLHDALMTVLQKSRRASVRIQPHDRAVFRISGDVDDYLREHLSRKRRKEFKRLRARLADAGEVAVERLATDGDVAGWLADFYALEQASWKGRGGTAIACDGAWQGFFDDAFEALAHDGDALFWRMTLDGKPVAMTMGLKRGSEAWLCKIAHDEEFARFSPGALIVFDVMNDLVADGDVEIIDSCAVPDHPMINHIWHDKIALHDLFITSRKTPAWQFCALVAYENTWREARAFAKRQYKKIKSLRAGGSS
jgi:hypothetical protein